MHNCSIFNISREDDNPEEFSVCNDYCDDDPLYLTREELQRLGEQLIELSKETDKDVQVQ